MSDVEFRAASLVIRESALWVAVAQVAISAAQTGIVFYGIRAMIRAADQRGRDAERDRAERAEAAADARREADRRHAESMAAINAMAATLAEQTAALKVVVERTAPGAGR